MQIHVNGAEDSRDIVTIPGIFKAKFLANLANFLTGLRAVGEVVTGVGGGIVSLCVGGQPGIGVWGHRVQGRRRVIERVGRVVEELL